MNIVTKAQHTENNGKDIIAQSHNAIIFKYYDQGKNPFITEWSLQWTELSQQCNANPA